MKRKHLLTNYTRRPGEDGKETYTYTGPWYTLDYPPGKRRQVILLCWLAPAAALVIFIFMGLMGAQGTYAAYVALPYVSIFLPTALLLGDAYKLTIAKKAMKQAEFGRCVIQMRRCTMAGMAFAGITFAGQTAFMLVSVLEDPAAEWLFWFLCLALFLVFCGFHCVQKRIRTICR